MSVYRLLALDGQGQLVRSQSVECVTDRQAIICASEMTGDLSQVEVWHDYMRLCVINGSSLAAKTGSAGDTGSVRA